MPPKVTDNRANTNEALHAVEAQTAIDARKIVASYSDDFFDAVTLMCMLGVEPEGLSHSKVAAEMETEAEEAAPKRTRKKAAKKAAKNTAKKAAKKTAKKATKKATKKAAKKTTKKAAKKVAKKTAE